MGVRKSCGREIAVIQSDCENDLIALREIIKRNEENDIRLRSIVVKNFQSLSVILTPTSKLSFVLFLDCFTRIRQYIYYFNAPLDPLALQIAIANVNQPHSHERQL